MLNMSIKNQDSGFASPQRAKKHKTQLHKEFQLKAEQSSKANLRSKTS
jgi:hypothetical protein